jgi:multicomponent Na+:H+ antiporter subunit D
MIAHIPILLLITPLFAAVAVSILNTLSKTNKLQKIVTAISLVLPFFYLSIIFQRISQTSISYNVGGWEKPFGITLIIDELSFILLLIASILIFVAFVYSLQNMKKDTGKFYFFFLLLTTALNGIFLSGDLFNIYIFFDLTIISSFILITFGDKKHSLRGSIKYLILGTLASLFLLLGIGFIYAETGVLNLEYLQQRIALIDVQTQIVIFAFFLAAVGIKAAIIPFHTWLVDAHSTAPVPISALLSGIIVKSGIYVFIRISSFDFNLPAFNEVVMVLGAITAVGGVIGALMQWDIKRITANHTISQIGFIIVGIGAGSTLGLAGGIYHMVNHAFFKALLFLCAGTLIYTTGSKDIRDYRIGWSMPITFIVYLIGILSISGITPFSGSVSKKLIETAIHSHQSIYMLLILASMGTVTSFSKILYYAFFKHPADKKEKKNVPVSMLVPMIVLAVFCVVLGIIPDLWLDGFILPASCLINGFEMVPQVSFINLSSILKEWGIVIGGLLLLFFIIRFSTIVDSLRIKISKIAVNQSIIVMIITLILISALFNYLSI